MTKARLFHDVRAYLRAGKLTDDEYVELIRHAPKIWAVLRLFILCCTGLAIFVAIDMCRRMLFGLWPVDSHNGKWFAIGFASGTLFGIVLWIAIVGLFLAIGYRDGWRAERLMLRFHDELQHERQGSQVEAGESGAEA